jgi:G3E family GTPase
MTKIDIVAGFYGAGKTRFLQKIMKEGIDKKTVAYMKCSNAKGEFDAYSMKKFGINGFEISINTDTKFYVETLVAAIQNTIDLYDPTRVVIELAGNMSVSKIKEAVKQVATSREVALNIVVTIVNVFQGMENIEKYPHIFQEQIEHAQSIVLSGTEEISKEELYAQEVALRKYNSHATVFVTPWDVMESINLKNAIEVTNQLESIVRNITAKEKMPNVYDRKKSEEIKVLEEQKQFRGLLLHTDRKFQETRIRQIIGLMKAVYPDIIRIKGSFSQEEMGTIHVDYLQGKLVILKDKNRATGNVEIIGEEIEKNKIEDLLI